MKKFVAAVFMGLLLAGCSTSPDTQSTTQLLTYQCGAVPLIVTFDNENDIATVILDGELRTLPRSISASGAKYDDGEYTFWTKGYTATVYKSDEIMLSDCKLIK